MKERYGYLVVATLSVLLAAVAVFITFKAIDINNHKFCQVVEATTANPVKKPAHPAQQPAQEQNYDWYVRFTALGHALGCD